MKTFPNFLLLFIWYLSSYFQFQRCNVEQKKLFLLEKTGVFAKSFQIDVYQNTGFKSLYSSRCRFYKTVPIQQFM